MNESNSQDILLNMIRVNSSLDPTLESDDKIIRSQNTVPYFISSKFGEAIIQLAAYNYNGQKGITCYLNAVCKTGDGTPLGGNVSYEDEFS